MQDRSCSQARGTRLGMDMRRIRSGINKKEFNDVIHFNIAFAGPGIRFQPSGAKHVQPAGRLILGSVSHCAGIVPDPILVDLLLSKPTTCRPDNTLLPAARDIPEYYVISRD